MSPEFSASRRALVEPGMNGSNDKAGTAPGMAAAAPTSQLAAGPWCSSQRRGGAGVARQPDRPVEQPGGRGQLAQDPGADVGAGVGERLRDSVRGAPPPVSPRRALAIALS